MPIVRIDPYSQAPLFTKMRFNSQELATGTSFFYRVKEQLFLISNWHNFSGRNANTTNPLSKSGGLPNVVSCYLCLDEQYIKREWFDFPLQDDSTNFWYEHPELGHTVDIGALPVELPEKYKAICINKLPSSDLRLKVSSDVFVLGYPLGLTDTHGLPVWKRASVATEPGTSLPRFLVDTATRPGMSGSPVIHRFRGFYQHDESSSGLSGDDWIGEGDSFVGIYSGRLGASEVEAQLGIVWKRHLIDEIAEGRKLYES
ncbi:MAG: hypothetical protein KDJ99_27015 [Candidatus Competibacteraceae bacterium]|nr:hypothetical protein [Candidatus Competibacteraceae bacterium]